MSTGEMRIEWNDVDVEIGHVHRGEENRAEHDVDIDENRTERR